MSRKRLPALSGAAAVGALIASLALGAPAVAGGQHAELRISAPASGSTLEYSTGDDFVYAGTAEHGDRRGHDGHDGDGWDDGDDAPGAGRGGAGRSAIETDGRADPGPDGVEGGPGTDGNGATESADGGAAGPEPDSGTATGGAEEGSGSGEAAPVPSQTSTPAPVPAPAPLPAPTPVTPPAAVPTDDPGDSIDSSGVESDLEAPPAADAGTSSVAGSGSWWFEPASESGRGRTGGKPAPPVVSLRLDGTPIPGCTAVPVRSDDTWRCEGRPVPAPGAHTLEVRADGRSASIRFIVRFPAPTPAVDPVVADDESALFTGTAFAGAGSVVRASVTGTEAKCLSSVSPTGAYSCTLGTAGLEPGDYRVEIVQRTWKVGSAPAAVTLRVPERAPVVPAPPVVDDDPAGGSTLGDSTTLGGGYDFASLAGGGGGSVVVDVVGPDGTTSSYCGTTVYLPGTATWSCTVPLAVGESTLSAHVVNVVTGTSSPASGPIVRIRGTADPVTLVVPDSRRFASGAAVHWSGTGPAMGRVVIERRTPGSGEWSAVCAIGVDRHGAWALDCVPPDGRWEFRAVGTDLAGGRTFSAVTQSILSGAAPTWPWTFGLMPSGQLYAGGDLEFDGSGAPPGTVIAVVLHSDPVLLGAATAGADGAFVFRSAIPASIEPGSHQLVLTATTPDGDEQSTTFPVVVLAPPVDAPPEPAPAPEPEPETEPVPDSIAAPITVASVFEAPVELTIPPVATAGPAAITEDREELVPEGEVEVLVAESEEEAASTRDEPGAPSALTHALPPIQHLAPESIVLAGLVALALLFLIAVPTEILNSTISSSSGRLGRGFRAIERRMDALQDAFVAFTGSRALAALILVVVVSVIFGFTDPDFGFDLTSMRLVLSLATAFFLLSYVASWITRLLVQRLGDDIETEISIQPAIIVFAIVGVIAARLLDFSPGFLIGLVIGLEMVRASRRQARNAVLIQAGVVLTLCMGSWIAYSMLADVSPDGFGIAYLIDTLVAIVAEGLTALLVVSFPLHFLEGRRVWEDSKLLWGALFFVVALAFSLLVLPTAGSGTTRGDVFFWILIFAGFALIAFTIWAVFTRLDVREPHRPEDEPEVDAPKQTATTGADGAGDRLPFV
ncbi:hypothetical protein [Agromyces seonyuensis]|uniref:Uncharacterized protein n=1 Tax=Agromyces seonyuensis TaxID=2662446 RepID=A0A6I4NWJ7_9MICO|nr:hypothetical protein [Agromyces seonyuensis]MWB98650.1 hypothetical protein [Agromyces seonyuensis]